MAREDNIVVTNYDSKRREALAEIDNAEFGWFHIRTCVVAGVGFFTDAYDIFAIPPCWVTFTGEVAPLRILTQALKLVPQLVLWWVNSRSVYWPTS